jgi:hypothetical protein
VLTRISERLSPEASALSPEFPLELATQDVVKTKSRPFSCATRG